MSRLEKVDDRQYVKVPSKIELDIISIINKYLSSTLFNKDSAISDKEVNSIIIEVNKQLNPIILNIATETANKLIAEALQDLI